MPRILSFIILTVFSHSAFSQEEMHPFVEQAKETSLYSENVDWPMVNTEFSKLIGDGKTIDELKPGLQYLINSLRDKHASVRNASDHSFVVYYTGDSEPNNRDGQFIDTVVNDLNARFSYQLLSNDVGYLRVVGIGPQFGIKENADLIRSGVKDLDKNGATKWIVDLRYNGGGNMNPMISGLAPLLGDGFIGGSVDANGNMHREYNIKAGQFYDTGNLVCEMDSKPEIEPTAKIAVLVSRYTISSGEIVAVAFKGRNNTRFFGEESAGYTTGNGYDQLSDDLILVISQSVFVDRNKKVYHEKVGVDEHIEFQHNTSLTGDQQVEQAIEWLNE